jgi:hypothetical protein
MTWLAWLAGRTSVYEDDLRKRVRSVFTTDSLTRLRARDLLPVVVGTAIVDEYDEGVKPDSGTCCWRYVRTALLDEGVPVLGLSATGCPANPLIDPRHGFRTSTAVRHGILTPPVTQVFHPLHGSSWGVAAARDAILAFLVKVRGATPCLRPRSSRSRPLSLCAVCVQVHEHNRLYQLPDPVRLQGCWFTQAPVAELGQITREVGRPSDTPDVYEVEAEAGGETFTVRVVFCSSGAGTASRGRAEDLLRSRRADVVVVVLEGLGRGLSVPGIKVVGTDRVKSSLTRLVQRTPAAATPRRAELRVVDGAAGPRGAEARPGAGGPLPGGSAGVAPRGQGRDGREGAERGVPAP